MNLIQRIHRLLVNLKQRTSRLLGVITACLAALLGLNASVNAATWYVDGSLTPCGDGISWGTAFRYLQDALNEPDLVAGDQIWVAAWTYQVDQDCANPVGSHDREETFLRRHGVIRLRARSRRQPHHPQRDRGRSGPIRHVRVTTGVGMRQRGELLPAPQHARLRRLHLLSGRLRGRPVLLLHRVGSKLR